MALLWLSGTQPDFSPINFFIYQGFKKSGDSATGLLSEAEFIRHMNYTQSVSLTGNIEEEIFPVWCLFWLLRPFSHVFKTRSSKRKWRRGVKLLFISSGTFFLPLSSFQYCLCFLPVFSHFLHFILIYFLLITSKCAPLLSTFFPLHPPPPNFFLYQSLTPLLSHLVFSISLSLFITLEVLMRLDCCYVSSALFCSLVFYFVPCCTAYYFVTACCWDRSLCCLESYLHKAKKQC